MLPTDRPIVSICIATHNMGHLIQETILNCKEQNYTNIEIVVYDDASTDGTEDLGLDLLGVRYFRGEKNCGVGKAFDKAIEYAYGDIIVLMCADDVFTNEFVISDIVYTFEKYPGCGVITRWYYQFIHEDSEKKPVRAWRTNNPVIQGNNPSGLAFRKEALGKHKLSNKMFIESSHLVRMVILDLWGWVNLKYDAIAARVHSSTSTTPGYWLKRRVSSPVMDWYNIGGKEIAKDYTSLLQIKNGFKMSAVFEEIRNFILLRPLNLINPLFWFYSILVIITPRSILRKIPHWYRWHIGRRITGKVDRPCA